MLLCQPRVLTLTLLLTKIIIHGQKAGGSTGGSADTHATKYKSEPPMEGDFPKDFYDVLWYDENASVEDQATAEASQSKSTCFVSHQVACTSPFLLFF